MPSRSMTFSAARARSFSPAQSDPEPVSMISSTPPAQTAIAPSPRCGEGASAAAQKGPAGTATCVRARSQAGSGMAHSEATTGHWFR